MWIARPGYLVVHRTMEHYRSSNNGTTLVLQLSQYYYHSRTTTNSQYSFLVKVNSLNIMQYQVLCILLPPDSLDRTPSQLVREELCHTAVHAQRLFVHLQISTTVYSHVFIHTAERTGGTESEQTCPRFDTTAQCTHPQVYIG